MDTFGLDARSLDLTLVEKGKQPYGGKPWDISKGGKYQAKKKGITSSKFDSNFKNKDGCFYCRKPGHHAKYCYKRKAHESKQRYGNHDVNFVNNDSSINEGFKNLKLFISQAAMSTNNDDKNAWYVDSGASFHMSCTIRNGLMRITRMYMEIIFI